jgi:hypothetical protein
MFVNFIDISSILLPFGSFYGHLHIIYFVVILVYFSRFGMLYQINLATLLTKTSAPVNAFVGGKRFVF